MPVAISVEVFNDFLIGDKHVHMLANASGTIKLRGIGEQVNNTKAV